MSPLASLSSQIPCTYKYHRIYVFCDKVLLVRLFFGGIIYLRVDLQISTPGKCLLLGGEDTAKKLVESTAKLVADEFPS
jgi:hypothetical protein